MPSAVRNRIALMRAKRIAVGMLGVLALAGGILLSAFLFRRLVLYHIGNFWAIADVAIDFVISAYLIWLAVRALRWTAGRPFDMSNKVKWGRVVLGVTFVYAEIKNYVFPNTSRLLQPSNETQAESMKFMAIVLTIVGMWLIISGIIARFRHPPEESEAAHLSSEGDLPTPLPAHSSSLPQSPSRSSQ